uniref:Putative rna-binding protein 15b n=3 Tax=Ixodes ricinus TaxID=34613 RepID=A0A131XVS8_IXORI
MKRQQDRDSPKSKRPMARYDDSPRGTPDRRGGDRRGSNKSPSEHRRRGGRDASADRGVSGGSFDDYRLKVERSPPYNGYKVLCLSNLNHKISDVMLRETLQDQFSRFGNVSVKVCHEGNEPVAYVYFRSYEEAKEARHAKSRLVLFDKQVQVEPVLRVRQRSLSPPPEYHHHHHHPSSSPGPRRMRMEHHRLPPPPPPPPPPPAMDHRGMDPRALERGPFQNRFRREDGKKEKFPNYLHHVPPEDDDKATRTLFVGNLEVTISEADLRRIFERYGVVEDVDVKRPPPGQGNAYAFIKFLNLDMAHRAKVEMSGQYIGKFQCKIGYGKATPSMRIWVGGLGSWTSLAHLEREFDRFGAIRKIDWVKGENHAYLQYDSIDAAQAACQEMRGFPLGGPDKRLRVDFADPDPFGYYPGFPAAGAPEPFRPDFPDPAWAGRYDEPRRWEASWGPPPPGVPGPPGGAAAPGPNWRPRTPPSPPAKRENGGGNSGSTRTVSTLQELGRTCASAWQGGLVLKNSAFPARMVLCSGDSVEPLLGGQASLRITQRLRLDPAKLADVERRLAQGCAILVALAQEQAGGQPQRPLRNLVSYLKQKEAAGVIPLARAVLYAFPPCAFALQVLRRACPAIQSADEDHLVVVVAPGT